MGAKKVTSKKRFHALSDTCPNPPLGDGGKKDSTPLQTPALTPL